MDSKPSDGGRPLAPSNAEASALRLPAARDFPPVDEHVVQPETTRDELIRGRRVVAMPALAPHADRQVELGYVIRAHIKPGFVSSAELLTRVGEGSDFATDVCVRKHGIDPSTGKRHLEELAFEVVSEQSMRDITEKAEDLTSRGVRRVVAIFVKKGDPAEVQRGEHGGVREGQVGDPNPSAIPRGRAHFRGFHCWARGYCVSTVGLDEDKIRRYIQEQEDEERRQEQLPFGGLQPPSASPAR